jgi:hypothetical protein
MNGAQCLGSLTDLYAVAGDIRAQFIALQDAMRAQGQQQSPEKQ